ncbi:MAG: hypothetical protein M0000_13085 [Actinomycetota bacterium]|nr:hypothetical protein [Actinomycetota bacterium]
MRFTEVIIDGAALNWLVSIWFGVKHGPEIALGEMFAERSDRSYCRVVLERRLRDALLRLNHKVPTEALRDTCRKLMCNHALSLVEHNRQVHRMLVDGPVRRGAGRSLPGVDMGLRRGLVSI